MLGETGLSLALLIAAVAAMNVIYNAATAIVASLIGLPVNRISIGVGPSLVKFPIGRAEFSLRLVPVAGSVSFSDADARPDLDEKRQFKNAGFAIKVLVAIVGPLSVVLASVPILGVAAFSEAALFWSQLWEAVLDAGKPLNFHALIWPMIAQAGYLPAGAAIAVKAASTNVLPIPILNGGALVMWSIEAAIGRPLPEFITEWLYRFGFALCSTVVIIILFRLCLGAFGGKACGDF